MPDITTVLKEHPLAAGGILVGVVVLAYMQSKSSSNGARSESYQYRGEVAAGIDPNAAAIEQSAISAGTANLGTIAQLVALQDTNRTALTGSLAQTGAARDVSLANTEAARTTTLQNIAANLRASMYSTDADRDVSLAQTNASVAVNSQSLATQLEAARISQDISRQQLAFETYAAKLRSDNANFAIQADKDKARAQNNTSIFTSLIGGAAMLFGL
jgi:hypothetical protein